MTHTLVSKKLIAFVISIIAIIAVSIFAPETVMYSCPAIGLAGMTYSGVQGAVDYKHKGNEG